MGLIVLTDYTCEGVDKACLEWFIGISSLGVFPSACLDAHREVLHRKIMMETPSFAFKIL